MVKVREDMTGWKMWEHGVQDSRLTVIRQTDDYVSPSGERKAQWLCECNCDEHNQVIVVGSMAKCGKIKSCGCLHSEQAVLNGKHACKNNEYELFDDYVRLKFTNVDDYFYVSLSDFNLISQYSWHRRRIKNYYYVVTNQSPTENGTDKYKALRLTALIGCKYYDHIDGDPRNCRRENLRPATAQENTRNRGLRSDNTSGMTGVYWNKKLRKWCASIGIGDKVIHLGVFVDKQDAIEARLFAEEKYFGEFAPQRHLFEEYGITVDKPSISC